MICQRCQQDNPAGTNFCGGCGARLAAGCPACGASNPLGQKYCGDCGAYVEHLAVTSKFASPGTYVPRNLAAKILTSRSAVEGERKQVTIMFADIKGSLELLADRDPEDARRLLDAVLTKMMDAVHRYEGTVNQVMGDGIMAIFGAPVAHEDHAVRACYAALRMQRRIGRYADRLRRKEGISVQVRIGIHSGEVVVRSIGSDLHMDYTAVGQTTHLAARMEQIATPGTILMTGASVRLAEGFFDFKPLGPVPIKGLTGPVEVYELVGAVPARSRLQAASRRGFTQFVGRASELLLLREVAAEAISGRGQVVALVGEAGVGKSRLLHEFLRAPIAQGCEILELQAVSYGHDTPYLPVVEFLRTHFRVGSRDDDRVVREKATAAMLEVDPSLERAIAPLLDLIGVLPDDHPFRQRDAQQRRNETIVAFSRLLIGESRRNPLIVVFEDLHWTDSPTLELLKGVIASVAEARVLILMSYRTEYQDEWATRPNYRRLHVEPLTGDSVRQLLDKLLGIHQSLSDLKTFLSERTEGNPFFIEELVRTLAETGVLASAPNGYRLARAFSGVQVPATVQAVLASRIDRLRSQDKHLLQVAAVIGSTLPFGILHAIAGLDDEELWTSLANLQSSELLYETRLYPDPEYTFKHALTHEVAYAGLLHQRRREIHAQIVEAMEHLYGTRLGEQVERLAHHALNGELWEKALLYLRQAGARAADRPASHEALALFGQALAVLRHLPETRETLEQEVDIRFDIRNVLQPMRDRDRIAGYLHEAEEFAIRLKDPRRLGWIQSYLTDHFWMLGRSKEAEEAGARALQIARQIDDLPLQVVTNLPLGLLYHTQGDYPRAQEYFEWNVAQLKGDLQFERFGLFVIPSSFSSAFLAWSFAELGEFRRGVSIAEEGIRIAEAERHPFSCGYAYLGMGVVRLRQGELLGAILSFERALAAGAFANIPVGYAYVAFHLGYALALSGRVVDGIAMLEKTVELAQSSGFIARHSLRLAYLAEAYLVGGRDAEADTMALQSLDLARKHRERGNEAFALRVAGEVAARMGKTAEAEERLRDAAALAQSLGMRPLLAECRWSLQRALRMMGKETEAAAERESAIAQYRSMEMRLTARAGVSDASDLAA